MKIEASDENEIKFAVDMSIGECRVEQVPESGTLVARYPKVTVTLTRDDVEELAREMGLVIS